MQEPTGPASLPELGEGSTGGARIPREYAVWLIPFPNIQRGLWVGTQCAAPLAPEKTEEEIVSDPANPQAQPSTCIIFIIIPPPELDLTPVKIRKPQTQHMRPNLALLMWDPVQGPQGEPPVSIRLQDPSQPGILLHSPTWGSLHARGPHASVQSSTTCSWFWRPDPKCPPYT